MKFALLALFFTPLLSADEVKRNVKYDTKHQRNVLDFFPALNSKGPAPVYVFFHGGGFRQGDKSQLERSRKKTLEMYRNAGFAVVTCNYPFLGKGMNYEKIARHCGRAVQFVRSKAEEWNIDPNRLCCGGVSAGALISEFLGYHDDLADPRSDDKIAQLSSRAQVVLSIMQPIGTREFALRFMEKGEAPIFIYSSASPNDRLHPPAQAQLIHEKAKELQIPTALYGGGRNDLPRLPKEKTWRQAQLEFCKKHLPAEKELRE
ncbi:MAG: alpha/beta hydrolase [Akkermansiaceae bacterium]